MQPVHLIVIAALPTYIAWCEKNYSQCRLQWFKSVDEFNLFADPVSDKQIILSEFDIDVSVPVIDIRDVNVYTPEHCLDKKIDNLIMYETLSTLFSSNVSTVPV